MAAGNSSKYDRVSYGGTAVNMTERVMTAGNSSKYDRASYGGGEQQ